MRTGGMAANADVPQEIIDALSRSRPICPRYNTYRGCNRGRKCKMIHGNKDEPGASLAMLPFVASHSLPDGTSYIVSRPPLAEAWTAFFQSHSVINRLGKGEESTLETGQKIIAYPVANMDPPDHAGIASAKTRDGATIKHPDGTFHRYGKRVNEGKCPIMLVRGTTVANGITILREGRMRASEFKWVQECMASDS